MVGVNYPEKAGINEALRNFSEIVLGMAWAPMMLLCVVLVCRSLPDLVIPWNFSVAKPGGTQARALCIFICRVGI